VTSPEQPPSVRPVDYKGEPLDAERGPGLGCFRFQVWNWPPAVSMGLLLATLILLLFAGQTVIFLLRLVAADRREGTRHAPRAGATPTVGQLEDGASVDALGRPIEARTPDTLADAQSADPGVRE
jgi:hypothetical protein